MLRHRSVVDLPDSLDRGYDEEVHLTTSGN